VADPAVCEQETGRLLSVGALITRRALLGRAQTCASGLLASVSRLKLVPNGKDQDDVFGGEPTVFRNISVPASREDEFPPAFFRGSPE
jgi:hypothetical protein